LFRTEFHPIGREEWALRVLLGMILGVLLTIGGAYIHDTQLISKPGVERQMVNWDVVSRNWSQLTARVRSEWNKLTG
jgi:hypothetical protein